MIFEIKTEEEWQCLKMALCQLNFLSSCYSVLSNDFELSRDLLKRLGVYNV